jgi:hypothetical protein
MTRSIIARSLLAASVCVLASSQVAFASARMSPNSIQSQDVNDTRNEAGRAAKAQAKLEGKCPHSGDTSSRYEVASASDDGTSILGSAYTGKKIRR